MGLIKAGIGAIGGVLADQWKEFFVCESLANDVLMVKGEKRVSGRSSNTKGSDNVITNGSGIVVADGQCMIIVEQGKVVEVCAEPGEFTYDTSSEPSIFAGSLGESIKETFKVIGKRFTYGGDTGKDQRVYYFNTKEIMDNKFGTQTPIMFEVVNKFIGHRRTVQVRCNGTFTYKLTDPLKLYTNIAGNVGDEYRTEQIMGQLKADFVDALQPALAVLSEQELRPAQIPAHAKELRMAMQNELADEWYERRGFEIVDITINPISLTEADMKIINEMEDAASMGSNPAMALGRMTAAQANAMETAAGNSAGAMTGFMGLGMAGNAMGGFNPAQQIAMMQQQQMQQQQMQPAPAAPAADGWKCSCGATATGNFCPNCGAKKPEQAAGWTCSCGTANQGKFCQGCGAKKPEGAPLYRCDKCGWQPEDPHNPPRFCPECGDLFDDNDKN